MTTISAIEKQTQDRMNKSVESMNLELTKLRTNRLHPGLIAHLPVACYGNKMPLDQLATVTVEDARTLLVSPWDKSNVSAVEKSLMTSDLGLNPTTVGTLIRVTVPSLSAERRQELVRFLHKIGEKARVSIRNVRRDAKSEVKKLLKEKALTEDDSKRAEMIIQKLTDKFISDIDRCLADKEASLLTV